MNQRLRRAVFLCIMVALYMLGDSTTVRAEGINLSYDGKRTTYNDVPVTYTLDGQEIASKYPGVIIGGVSLAPCKDIFINSGMGITYKYNSKTGALKLQKGSTTIVMVVGSKTAKINGQKVKIDLAPRNITFTDLGVTKLYVPARFIAETFGYSYSWDRPSATSSMKSPAMSIKYDGKRVSYAGEKVIFSVDKNTCNTSTYPGMVIDKTILGPCKLIFTNAYAGVEYNYNSTTKTVTLSKFDTVLEMVLGSKNATLNGEKVTLPAAPRSIKFYSTGISAIYVPVQFVAETFGFSYDYNKTNTGSSVALESPWALFYQDNWNIYNGVKGNVTFNGNEIDVTPMYSFILNNTAMLRAKKVFSTEIGCSYSYNADSNTLTLANSEHTVIFTLDSTQAIVDGETKELSVPAMTVINSIDEGSYIVVPGQFTAEALGYDYQWNEASKTSEITTKKVEIPTPEEPEPEPETPVVPNPPDNSEQEVPSFDTYFTWNPLSQHQAYLDKISSSNSGIYLTGKQKQEGITNLSSLNDVTRTEVNAWYETFQITSLQGFYEVNGGIEDDTKLVLTLPSTSSADREITFNGTELSTAASTRFDSAKMETKVTFYLTDAVGHYKAELSDDFKTVTITLYKKALTKISGGSRNGTDVLLVSGTKELEPEYTTDINNPDLIIITLRNIADTIGQHTWQPSTEDSSFVSITTVPIGNDLQILVQKTSVSDYFLEDLGTSFELRLTNPTKVTHDLEIPIPSTLNTNQIEDEDFYEDYYFTITLPGDQRSYLTSNPITYDSSFVSGITYSLDSLGNTVLKISTVGFYAYRIHYTKESLLVEIGDPKSLYDKIVVLDPGHGGSDPGTGSNGVDEKDLTLKILYDNIVDYFKDSDIKVYWTRKDDSYPTLNERAAYASKVSADLFISLHIDAFTTSKPEGLSVYHSSVNKNTNSGGLTSVKLATILHDNLIEGLSPVDRGVKDNTYVVCKTNTVPAVLIELGFITNPSEFKKLTNPEYQQKTAQIIYESIVEIFEKYPTNR